MRAAWAILLLAGCGDVVGPDRTRLCVEPAFEAGEGARIMAVYHARDEDPVLIDDVAVVDGRGCLTLRPPPDEWFEAVALDQFSGRGTHEVRAVDEGLVSLRGGEPFKLSVYGVLIDLAVYTDGDRSGDFQAPDAAGEGPDQLLTRLSASARAQLPIWLGELTDQMQFTPPELLPLLLDHLAPGNQPFAVTKPVDAPRAWRGADKADLITWPSIFKLPPTATGTWCDIGSAWPRCRSVTDEGAYATARLVDPRVPAAAVSLPITGFDPGVPLPPGDAPVSAQVEARQCADVGAYRVARERTIVPRQDPESCVCNVYVRTRYVIALADDPPEWLSCVGRPLSPGAGAALAAEVGLSGSGVAP